MKNIAQTQSFTDLIDFGYIYIDKTEQIFNLLKNRRAFISRPRRFGKSLMLDTVGTLFESGVEPYFKGTWIYDKWTERKYPVLRLNFLKYTSEYDDFKRLFSKDIEYFANKLGIGEKITPNSKPDELMFDILKALNELNLKTVILIDEYDTQLTANINNPELYEKFRKEIRNLYGIMKGDPCIRFLGVTGVTRLKDVSVFSAGSDILDVSYASEVAKITGFTREDLKKYYIDYINLAVSLDKGIREEQVTAEQREELLDRLAEEYNGYCFDETHRIKVYSTWSINCFFMNAYKKGYVVFGDYWYDNGGMPSILERYLETHKIRLENYANDIDVKMNDFWNPSSLLNMRQEVLMCQTGYLTVKSTVPDGGSVTVGIPDNEVRRSFEKLLSQNIFATADFSKTRNEKLFSEATPEDIVGKLNKLFNTISYEDFKKIDEKIIQGYLHAYMAGSDQPVQTEVQSATGRSDIILEYSKRRLVLELKYAETEAECEKKLSEAVEQIKNRNYGETLPEKPVLKLALVFNGDSKVRQFTHYETVE